MPIETDDLIVKHGTQDTVTAGGGTSAVSNGAFSAAADAVEWTNDDNTPLGKFALTWQYASGTIAAAGQIHLYARLKNIDGAADEAQPDASNKKHLLGSFRVDSGLATATNEVIAESFPLVANAASQVYEFYIENETNVTISAGWILKVTPGTEGPKA